MTNYMKTCLFLHAHSIETMKLVWDYCLFVVVFSSFFKANG